MDSGFDQNQSKLGVHVLAVSLQVLAHGHGFLDQTVQIFRQSRRQTLTLQDAHDFGVGHRGHLRDAVVISQDDADLRRRHAFLRHLRDHVFDFIRGGFAPERRRSFERDGRFGHPFSFAVHATHVCKLVFCCFLEKKRKEEVSILLFVTFFVAEDICTTHSPKKVFSLRTKIARPSSRRRCAQNTTTPGNDHNIRNEYVHNDTKTVASARSYLRISSNKTHSSSSRSTFLSRSRQKEASFLCANEEKKMKNLNESSAEEEPNANGAFNRSIARSIQPILVRAKTNGFEREREYTHTCVSFARTFS